MGVVSFCIVKGMNFINERLAKKTEEQPDNWIKNLDRMLKRCNLDGVRDAFKSFLASIPYEANKDERAKDFASVRLNPFGRIAVGKPPQVWEPVGLILFTVLHILKDLVILALWSCRLAIVAAGRRRVPRC